MPYYTCTRDALFTRECLESSGRVSELWLDEWQLTYEHYSKSYLIKNNDDCYKWLVLTEPANPLYNYYNIKRKYEIRKCPTFECYEGDEKNWGEDICISPSWDDGFKAPNYLVKECGPDHKEKKDICRIPDNVTTTWGMIRTPWNITCEPTHEYIPFVEPLHLPGYDCENST